MATDSATVILRVADSDSKTIVRLLGVLNIDLANRVIEHLTGVATGSNA